jgi:hypothetical protein
MPAIWRWTAILVHALRHALCPSPGLLALVTSTVGGELAYDLNDAPRRRQMQSALLSDVLGRWLLG